MLLIDSGLVVCCSARAAVFSARGPAWATSGPCRKFATTGSVSASRAAAMALTWTLCGEGRTRFCARGRADAPGDALVARCARLALGEGVRDQRGAFFLPSGGSASTRNGRTMAHRTALHKTMLPFGGLECRCGPRAPGSPATDSVTLQRTTSQTGPEAPYVPTSTRPRHVTAASS